ncbi:MAG: carboxymuconolactone decarboxylase family protein [Fimbriimonadaceae bacterium]|nr:carboxymuconolactone decarboxylase family protein [Alphaproteobacteria bacterium]
MAIFPKLGTDAAVVDILKMSPEMGIALMHVHHEVMRAPSPLSEGERELISAYVSGLNNCRYCYGTHAACAEAYGVPRSVMNAWYDDLEGSGVDGKMIPLLKVAKILTENPSGMTESAAQEAYDAGWDEQALHDAISVICCFNFMNRLLEGHDVHGHDGIYAERGKMLKEHGYLPLIDLVKPKVKVKAGART